MKWLLKLVESQQRYDRVVMWVGGTVLLIAGLWTVAVVVAMILRRWQGA